jgi:hypothetical protein
MRSSRKSSRMCTCRKRGRGWGIERVTDFRPSRAAFRLGSAPIGPLSDPWSMEEVRCPRVLHEGVRVRALPISERDYNPRMASAGHGSAHSGEAEEDA